LAGLVGQKERKERGKRRREKLKGAANQPAIPTRSLHKLRKVGWLGKIGARMVGLVGRNRSTVVDVGRYVRGEEKVQLPNCYSPWRRS
jgi:hypothetical protein